MTAEKEQSGSKQDNLFNFATTSIRAPIQDLTAYKSFDKPLLDTAIFYYNLAKNLSREGS